MRRHLRPHTLWLVILALTLLAASAFAQVPQAMTYTGRLVDGLGDPLAGPVYLDLGIYDAETGGTLLYREDHLATALDATGGFSVQLGMGTSPSGPFDADLFLGVDRWLQVTVGLEVLMPRQPIGSVPWALIAQQANEIVADPNAPRFEDCSDGTVADRQTGLQWEKKTGTVGSAVTCETAGCPDPHNVNNVYEWSDTGTDPDGNVFTDFLKKLNGLEGTFDCFVYCDWRLPLIGELRTIMIGPDAAPGQAQTCPGYPCLDPEFAALGGPSAGFFDWSASTSDSVQSYAWVAIFNDGYVATNEKTNDTYVRAVRVGSCN